MFPVGINAVGHQNWKQNQGTTCHDRELNWLRNWYNLFLVRVLLIFINWFYQRKSSFILISYSFKIKIDKKTFLWKASDVLIPYSRSRNCAASPFCVYHWRWWDAACCVRYVSSDSLTTSTLIWIVSVFLPVARISSHIFLLNLPCNLGPVTFAKLDDSGNIQGEPTELVPKADLEVRAAFSLHYLFSGVFKKDWGRSSEISISTRPSRIRMQPSPAFALHTNCVHTCVLLPAILRLTPHRFYAHSHRHPHSNHNTFFFS